MIKLRNDEKDDGKFWCRHCGSPLIIVHYVYHGYGIGRLLAIDSDTKEAYDYQTDCDDGSSTYTVEDYSCEVCQAAGSDLVTQEVDEVKDLPNFMWEEE